MSSAQAVALLFSNFTVGVYVNSEASSLFLYINSMELLSLLLLCGNRTSRFAVLTGSENWLFVHANLTSHFAILTGSGSGLFGVQI